MAQVVRGQTALFALIAFALKAACYPSTYGALSLLRTSPLFCLADLVVTLAAIPIGLFNGLKAREAYHVFLRLCAPWNNGSSDRPYTALVTRLCVFVLATMPQLLKLIGTKGLPWTMTWSVIFLLASVTSAVSMFLSSRKPTLETSASGPPFAKTKANVVAFRKVAHDTATFTQGVLSCTFLVIHLHIDFHGSLVIFSGTTFLLGVWMFSFFDKRRLQSNPEFYLRFFLVTITFISSVCLAVIAVFVQHLPDPLAILATVAAAILGFVYCFLISHFISCIIVYFVETIGIPLINYHCYWDDFGGFGPTACLSFDMALALMTLGDALYSYLYLYESKWSVQESWTRILGS